MQDVHADMNTGLSWKNSIQQVGSFHQQNGFKFTEEINEVLNMGHS
jgi:hypothetical protein